LCVFLSLVLALAFIVAFAGAAPAQTDLSAIRATKQLQPLRITETIVIDGRLDEPAWARAQVGRDFYQQDPDEGALSSEPSEVRFLYDDRALYWAGTFFDSDPRGPIVNELKRDFDGRNGDIVSLSLDTFGDLTAYNFSVNGAGALRDTQSHEDGRVFNGNWDGVWTARTSRFEGRWTVEAMIPFTTMRFPEAEEQNWGMNVFRLIRRKNESTFWSPQPRQFFAYKISYGGRLTGLRNVRPGRNLQIKPFFTGASSNLALPNLDRRWDADAGLDAKYGIGTALALDLTLHTDFSQVEARRAADQSHAVLAVPSRKEGVLPREPGLVPDRRSQRPYPDSVLQPSDRPVVERRADSDCRRRPPHGTAGRLHARPAQHPDRAVRRPAGGQLHHRADGAQLRRLVDRRVLPGA
jgi:hypothetical protein